MIAFSFRLGRRRALLLLIPIAAALLACLWLCGREQPLSPEQTLEKYGISAVLAEEREVWIPEEFPPVFADYNQLQRRQGYDLEKLAGKRCVRKRYAVDGQPGLVADLLVYKNKVVGGDLHRQLYGEQPRRLDGGV